MAGLKTALMIWTLPHPSIHHVAFLQNLIETARFAEVFLPDFPHAMHQALALPLAEPGMSWANITRYVYMLAAVGAEVMRIAHFMNSCHTRMLELLDGEPAAIPIVVVVEPEEFDFEGNLDGKS